MRFFPCVDQVVFLEMGQLSETLFAQVTLERPLATVHSEMYLKLHRSFREKRELCCQMASNLQKYWVSKN